MKLYISRISTPLGDMLLVADGAERVYALDFADHRSRLQRLLRQYHGSRELIDAVPPTAIASALQRYFEGDLAAAAAIGTVSAGSDLQCQVWEALRRIPVGKTTSYGDLARSLGFDDPRAAKDVGSACGANPIDIIVPCHRVIARDGSLRGYAGGLLRKRWLLEHEGAIARTTEAVQVALLPGF